MKLRWASLVALAACSSLGPEVPPTPVELVTPGEAAAAIEAAKAATAVCAGLDPAGLEALHPNAPAAALSYDPAQALHLDLIQGSALALTPEELAVLGEQGLVLSEARRFPSFTFGYQSIYQQDLPIFVSADSVLFAVHRSFDAILEEVELARLIPELEGLLSEMRARLAAGGGATLGDEVRRDVDLYLAVAAALLSGAEDAQTVAGGDDGTADDLVSKALAASGPGSARLFGRDRAIDFSQFVVRGHYTSSEALKRYFRAMMWLGTVDFRLIETDESGATLFRRRDLEGAFVLAELASSAGTHARWETIHGALGAFVGAPDSLSLNGLPALLADLGLGDAGGLAALPDATIAQAIVDGGYGEQRILSRLMTNPGAGTLPFDRSFLLFGQAYVLDSHVFSNVVWDRTQSQRMMPDPLDVAFAALGNDAALPLLEPQLDEHGYAPNLCEVRELADAQPEYFQGSLYGAWLGALRALSPSGENLDTSASGLPGIAGTDAWSRRVLSAQLASWAELRHDTILYAKQSYTSGDSCEYPDGYVEPYPQFFAAIAAFAARGSQAMTDLGLAPTYFDGLAATAQTLGAIAEHERTGTPLDAAQIAFLNDAVVVEEGCGGIWGVTGWYTALFHDPLKGAEFDPTIADVHTQPTLPGGADVGRVLHVGTGYARLMVVTIETCSGPRAYVGLASSYFETVTENYERLTDEQWSDAIVLETPADPPWLAELVVR